MAEKCGRRRDDDRWFELFGAYRRYVNENHRFPRSLVEYEGYRIGDWFRNQVSAWKGGFLPEERRELMDAFQPAWREPIDVRRQAEREMSLNFDWKGLVPAGDVCIDSVLKGAELDACVSNGVYSCRQYWEVFEKAYGCDLESAWNTSEGAKLVHRFGEGTYSLVNRKAVFDTLFPRVGFFGFHVFCCVFYGGHKTKGETFLEIAEDYNRRSPVLSIDEMNQRIRSLAETLTKQEADVLYGRFEEGQTLLALAKQLGVTPERIRQVENKMLRKMRQPSRVKTIAPLSDVQLLQAGRWEDTLEGTMLVPRRQGETIDLAGSACSGLPKGLTCVGSLNLQETPLKRLPEGLWVQGDLFLEKTGVRELPGDLVVDGSLYLPDTVLKIPETIRVGGEIFQERSESYVREDALMPVGDLGISEEIVEVLERKGIYCKMDILDWVEDCEKPLDERLAEVYERVKWGKCEGDLEREKGLF